MNDNRQLAEMHFSSLPPSLSLNLFRTRFPFHLQNFNISEEFKYFTTFRAFGGEKKLRTTQREARKADTIAQRES